MVAESVRLVQEEAPEILPREESEDDHPQLHRRRPSRRPPAQIRPWSIPRRLPPWFATLPPGVFTDPEGVSKALERLTDITDVLYVASDPRSKDAATREVYGAMLSNRSILFVVVPNCCKPVLVRLHAILSNQSVALVVGATGIGILPLGDDPGVPWKVYAISGHPLPSGIFHGPFDRADSEDVAKAKPLTDITRVLYIAWDPRPTDAAAREANCDMLSNSSELPQICPRLYFGMLRHSSPNSTGTGYIQREHLNIMNKTKEYGFFGLQNKVYSYQQLARRIPKELSMSFEFRQPKYLPAKSGGDCSNPKITNDVGQDAGKRQRKVGQVSHMTWRQTRRVILLVLILGNFMSKVNAVAETHMCPVRTIVDVLPAKSCPVILSTSDYWFHSKRTARGGTHHNTSCNVYKDWFVMLATASPWVSRRLRRE